MLVLMLAPELTLELTLERAPKPALELAPEPKLKPNFKSITHSTLVSLI
jgi:hypothetical protein